MPPTNKKRTSKAGTSQAPAVKDAGRKRQAKKWSKDKVRQKQKELDGQLNAVYAAILPSTEHRAMQQYSGQNDVQALEETLRGL